MQIKTKLLINAGLPLILVMTIGLMLFFANRRINEARDRARIASDITNEVLEMNLFIQRYLRFHEERPRIQIQVVNDSLERSLESFTAKSPEEQELINTIRRNKQALGVLLSELMKTHGEMFKGQTEDSRLFEERVIGQIVARTWEIISGAFQLADTMDKRIRAIQDKRNFSIMAMLILVGTGVISGSLLVGKNIIEALTNLKNGTEIIAGGKLDYRVHIESNDEIGQLSHSFNQMGGALQESYAALERSNRELQEFAFVASHDLQEPLRKIQSFGERLKTKYEDSLGDEGKDYLERMTGAAKRMQGLIQALLSYSRVTTKAEPFSSVDLNRIAQEVLADLETTMEATGGRVKVSDLPTLEADPNQMRQLFQNLLSNALKFHGEEKPLIKISGQRMRQPQVSHYMILVEDNGIGFDEKYLDRIFNPFQRLHGRGTYEGTGIGLAICRKIAERHGGNITARSTPGKGSTFIITLPAEQPRKGSV